MAELRAQRANSVMKKYMRIKALWGGSEKDVEDSLDSSAERSCGSAYKLQCRVEPNTCI